MIISALLFASMIAVEKFNSSPQKLSVWDGNQLILECAISTPPTRTPAPPTPTPTSLPDTLTSNGNLTFDYSNMIEQVPVPHIVSNCKLLNGGTWERVMDVWINGATQGWRGK